MVSMRMGSNVGFNSPESLIIYKGQSPLDTVQYIHLSFVLYYLPVEYLLYLLSASRNKSFQN